MKFVIEQLALAPKRSEIAKLLLTEMGILGWTEDTVVARGEVFGQSPRENTARLSFNYTALARAHELEILKYTDGTNWIDGRGSIVSHIGMHCSEHELVQWTEFFTSRGFRVAQAVETLSHTNPVIAGKRTYRYVIFDTHAILGVDVKFIVRREAAQPKGESA